MPTNDTRHEVPAGRYMCKSCSDSSIPDGEHQIHFCRVPLPMRFDDVETKTPVAYIYQVTDGEYGVRLVDEHSFIITKIPELKT